MNHEQGDVHDQPGEADAGVLGQLLAAQSLLSVLPTAQHVADFFAQALVAVPGVGEARACLPGAYSRKTARGRATPDDACAVCLRVREPRREGAPPPCRFEGVPPHHVLAVETTFTPLGSLVLRIEDARVFQSYRPFVQNVANVVAVWLENRLQQGQLSRDREALEREVEERTGELRAANRRLEEEIEQRRRAEAAVRELNAELERRVEDRTAELAAANQELEAFAYSVSHDLRAPLRHITGFQDLLQERVAASLDAQGRHYLAMISSAARRMTEMIDDLLAFSRMGRCELSRGSVDLGALVREVVDELQPDTQGRTVRWQIGALPAVSGDRAMLRMVLVNLLSNALKFTRPRAEAVIEIGREEGPGGEPVVFVRDNGVGFDMAYVDKLFRVFERLHHPAEFEGTGIGLANVRRIVQRHGGRTWAEGALDRGAKISFSLTPA